MKNKKNILTVILWSRGHERVSLGSRNLKIRGSSVDSVTRQQKPTWFSSRPISAPLSWKELGEDFKMEIQELLQIFRGNRDGNFGEREICACLADTHAQRTFVQENVWSNLSNNFEFISDEFLENFTFLSRDFLSNLSSILWGPVL